MRLTLREELLECLVGRGHVDATVMRKTVRSLRGENTGERGHAQGNQRVALRDNDRESRTESRWQYQELRCHERVATVLVEASVHSAAERRVNPTPKTDGN